MMISSTCLFVMFHTEDMNLTYLVVDDAGIFGLEFQSKRKVSVLMFFFMWFFSSRIFSSPIYPTQLCFSIVRVTAHNVMPSRARLTKEKLRITVEREKAEVQVGEKSFREKNLLPSRCLTVRPWKKDAWKMILSVNEPFLKLKT